MKRALLYSSLIVFGFSIGILVSNLTGDSDSDPSALVATSQTPAIDARSFADKMARDPRELGVANAISK